MFNVNNTYGSLALGNSDQQPNDPSQNRNYSFIDNVTWIKGRHQLKFGVDIRFLQYDNFAGTVNGGLSGTFEFSPLSTADLSSPNSSNQGNAWASLLLGQVSRPATDSCSATAYARRILRMARGRRSEGKSQAYPYTRDSSRDTDCGAGKRIAGNRA